MMNYSFIIPHHNTPELLKRLVDSIPMREDIEIIVVDDNSDADKKATVLRADVKTIFIDKDHTKGAGRARNIGIDAASGKWLLFADSDDFYKQNFIEVLDDYKDDDIEILYYNMDSVDSDSLESLTNTRYNRARIVQKIIGDYDGSFEKGEEVKYFSYGPWRKMIKHDFVLKYNMKYEEISRGNDGFFSLQTAYFVKRFKVDKRVVYCNTFRRGSTVFSKTTKQKYIDDINRNYHIYRFLKYIGHQDWNRNNIKGHYYFSPIKYLYRLTRKEPRTGLMACMYFIIHFKQIFDNRDYYVKTVKEMALKATENKS